MVASYSFLGKLTFQNQSQLSDIPNSFSANDPTIQENPNCYYKQDGVRVILMLHLLSCVGDTHPSQHAATADLVYNSISSHLDTQSAQISIRAIQSNGQDYNGPLDLSLIGPVGQPVQVLSVPAAYNGSDAPPGIYSLQYNSGGPTGASYRISVTNASGTTSYASSASIEPGNWSLSFTVQFTSGTPLAPSVTTGPASSMQSDGATLTGSVNPNGTATTVWFEWGTSSTLVTFKSTAGQALGSGTSAVSVSFGLGGLQSNTTYYYRLAASNGVQTVRDTAIQSFTTLGTLPEPTLQSPSNGASGVVTSPNLSWTAVANATSYRLIVATSPSALPTDPTVGTCGAGCVLNVTPTGTGYSVPSGVLASGTSYYWEVHARSSSQYGDWSAIFSFATGASAANDFSLQVTPSTQSVVPSGTVAYGIATTTASGAPQTILLSASNLPTGCTAVFTPNLLTSGNSGVFAVTTSSSTPPGTYTLTVLASGSSPSHSAQVSLVVSLASGAPVVSLAPTSLGFSDQTAGTVSQSQAVTIVNTGTAPLIVNQISLAAGSDYVVSGITSFPLSPLPPNTQVQFQVAFLPSTIGTRNGQVLIWDNAPNSPQVVPLSGNGLAAPPTNGTIQVMGTLNGIPLPNTAQFSYPFSYALTGPSTFSGGGAATFTANPGQYTISFSGNPNYLTLASVTPSAKQTVTAGNTVSFTLNFTAQNDFLYPSFMNGGVQVVPAGVTANYTIDVGVPPGNAATPITLQVAGTPPGANSAFNPEPVYSNTSSSLAVATSATTTPIGAYTLMLTGTNSSGLTHPGANTGSLFVTAPPASPTQLVSVNTAGTQANARSSYTTNSATSADGRFIAFSSGATNLSANAGNGQTHVYLRDAQSATTMLVDLANDWTPANSGASNPTISSNGRYIAFVCQASNLPLASSSGAFGVYLRDLQLGQTEREDVTSRGSGANGSSSTEPTVSADGRFVAFVSNATNLVPGIVTTNSQIYVRDRKTGNVVLASIGNDGSPATQGALLPSISADGRYVAFLSNSTNLVLHNTGGSAQVYIRDLQSGSTSVASVANDGSAANSGVLLDYRTPALSADGRYVAFMSNATNLVPGSIDANGDLRAFMRDLQSQKTILVDTDALGLPLSQGGTGPTISADGRFIAYAIYNQTVVRDMTGGHSVVVSVAADGTPGNNTSLDTAPPSISSAGTDIAFGSSATNLISNDTNNAVNIYEVQNPLVGTPRIASIALSSSSIGGGASITGTISLSAPAPSTGTTVALSSNNRAAQVPATVLIPPAATSAPFSLGTAVVPNETPLTITASYNGSASVAVLTLEPAPALSVAPSSLNFGDQPISTTSNATSLTLSNIGTATLTIDSIGLVSGQLFKTGASTCGTSLSAGSTCSVSITFTPTVSGLASDTLQIGSSNPANVQSVSLIGNGATASVTISPGTVSFGRNLVHGSSLAIATVTNIGNAPLANISVSIGGTNAPDFSISSDNCTGSNLPAKNTCLVTLNFSPKAQGTRNASLVVSDNAPGSPQTSVLSGTAADFSSTTLASSKTPGVIGADNQVMFTATVTGAYAIPTGSVTFLDQSSNVSLGTATLNGAGVASLTANLPPSVTPPLLAQGAHLIVAVYSGDAVYFVSTSSPVGEIVEGASQTTTTATLTSNPPPPIASFRVYAQPIVVTVTITPGAGGTTGESVALYDGTTKLSTATLNASGVATFTFGPNTVPTLPTGLHDLMVVYQGDTNYSAGISPIMLMQRTIKPR